MSYINLGSQIKPSCINKGKTQNKVNKQTNKTEQNETKPYNIPGSQIKASCANKGK